MQAPDTPSPLDDTRQLLSNLPVPDQVAAEAVRARLNKADRLGELAVWLAGWRGRPVLAVNRPTAVLFAGAHGVARHGVSALPAGATAELVQTLGQGQGRLNALCAEADLGLKVFELALDHPTEDITERPALDERGCAATIAFGMEAVAGGADLLVLGSAGVGAEVSTAAILTALEGGEPSSWLPENTPEHIRRRAAEAAQGALLQHRGHLDDPLDLLCRLGGREFAALLGAIIAARTEKVPVILDGAPALAAAALLARLAPGALEHCKLAHSLGAEKLDSLASRLGLSPLLDLGLSAGDGSAGVIAAGLVKSAAKSA
ncbi:MAG: nicotinate-nucleotide--dimethylbenzimidazole phosphoribosyltransferase [Methylobacterium mesophilicum]|nr:nicotinate-nucleotide--dimethylbenzimidazole phosphoribosyltransferase [Methylobacterium mesophilicum]